ncbi:Altronate dehydratase-like protein [Halogeometricum pallidum JCM 14848]|uniref:Altronate dehydratase-like protein n=1 Tax=Halogeometricum pallidum JCM 14848 TaxID=1227487 RepID=M0CXJ6_HALPD|nr:UxaA family hydrolase [Halogeometricum pallidum]ELZ27946.1 Altronate dehydratase-like protein [Halogeometricum pallidum JCM 14848]
MSVPSVTGRTFEGVSRDDGSIGVRDNVLVLPSVICSHIVADRIATRVDNAVSAPHDHGCAQLGADNEQTRRTFLSLAQNPNIAGTVVVGLGCEEIQSADVAGELESRNVPVRELSIQGVGGTDECVERGVDAASDLVSSRRTDRSDATIGDLTLGIVSSDLDASTVDVADPLVGHVARAVVAAGGRVVVAGNERVVAHSEAVRETTDETARDSLDDLVARHDGHPPRATRVGRFARKRSFEEVTRSWGTRDVSEVLAYGERASVSEGLALVDAPSRFGEATTALAAAGANVVVHVTGDGILAGHPLVPVVKVTGDPGTAAALPDDIDVEAANADADDLLETLVAVANGERCRAEEHGLTEFAITRVGPSM